MHIRDKLLGALAMSLLLGSASAVEPVGKTQTRCGWFDNPTPGNVWLHDRDGEWTVGIQGEYQAEGDWPDFKASQWVRTNGHYGYGCACIQAVANEKTREIVRISSAKARPLSTCRRDPSLKEPEH